MRSVDSGCYDQRNGNRTYPCAFDCGTGQAESCDRGAWCAAETTGASAEESAGGCDRSCCSGTREKAQPQCRDAESSVRADEGLLGEEAEGQILTAKADLVRRVIGCPPADAKGRLLGEVGEDVRFQNDLPCFRQE